MKSTGFIFYVEISSSFPEAYLGWLVGGLRHQELVVVLQHCLQVI
jgi:hypothetical protein